MLIDKNEDIQNDYEFLIENEISQSIKAMLKRILIKQPKNPFDFMLNFLKKPQKKIVLISTYNSYEDEILKELIQKMKEIKNKPNLKYFEIEELKNNKNILNELKNIEKKEIENKNYLNKMKYEEYNLKEESDERNQNKILSDSINSINNSTQDKAEEEYDFLYPIFVFCNLTSEIQVKEIYENQIDVHKIVYIKSLSNSNVNLTVNKIIQSNAEEILIEENNYNLEEVIENIFEKADYNNNKITKNKNILLLSKDSKLGLEFSCHLRKIFGIVNINFKQLKEIYKNKYGEINSEEEILKFRINKEDVKMNGMITFNFPLDLFYKTNYSKYFNFIILDKKYFEETEIQIIKNIFKNSNIVFIEDEIDINQQKFIITQKLSQLN